MMIPEKAIGLFVALAVLSGCHSQDTVIARIATALPESTLGPVLVFESEAGCAYAEVAIFEGQPRPGAVADGPPTLGRHWTQVAAIDQLGPGSDPAAGYDFRYLTQALVAARNCVADRDRFEMAVWGTPGVVTTDRTGEQVILVPDDPTLPLFYFAGQI